MSHAATCLQEGKFVILVPRKNHQSYPFKGHFECRALAYRFDGPQFLQ